MSFLLPAISSEICRLNKALQMLKLQGQRRDVRQRFSRDNLVKRLCSHAAQTLKLRVLAAWRGIVRETILKVELYDERAYRLEVVLKQRTSCLHLHAHRCSQRTMKTLAVRCLRAGFR